MVTNTSENLETKLGANLATGFGAPTQVESSEIDWKNATSEMPYLVAVSDDGVRLIAYHKDTGEMRKVGDASRSQYFAEVQQFEKGAWKNVWRRKLSIQESAQMNLTADFITETVAVIRDRALSPTDRMTQASDAFCGTVLRF